VVIPFSKDEVKSAPNFETDQPLSESDESQLYSHYRMAGTANGAGYGDSGTGTTGDISTGSYTAAGGTTTGTTGDSVYDVADNRGTSSQGSTGHDTSGPNTDDAMTRSEERLAVGTETVQTGKARLRKYIVTENVTQTVPVSHEEVRIEREPITEANVGNALSGPELSEEEHEVTLTGERVVTSKETVPVERVRLTTDTVQGEETVDETVRKEQIDTVYPDEPRVSDRERADKI
jgi:uncharacterized protein (TIGR02271 family)